MEAGGRSFLLPVPAVPQRSGGIALCIRVRARGHIPAWWKGGLGHWWHPASAFGLLEALGASIARSGAYLPLSAE